MIGYQIGDFMKEKHVLPLDISGKFFFYHTEDLKRICEETSAFLEEAFFLNNLDFVYRVLFSQEVKSNNTIEGYLDDINLIKSIIRHPSNILNNEEKLRILNLYQGYRYITAHYDVNKESLRKLYNILSNGLLSQEDKQNMGEFYRKNPVYIFYSNRFDILPDQGIEAEKIDEAMQKYFNFFHESVSDDLVSYYIHSQILHFYFCVIHPYYDINGRTSRTMSMWYLLNHNAYPFIIFNRAIQLDKIYYYKVIRESKKYANITCFLKYMLENGIVELEKEAVMQEVASSSSTHLSASDYQTLYYILSMKGNWTLADFASFYNRLNDKKRFQDIYLSMLDPLFQKEILTYGPKTKRFFNNIQNSYFTIAPNKLENIDKYKHLDLKRKL